MGEGGRRPEVRRSRSERSLPIGLLAVVALMAALVLPSSLRPPPDQANNSAALSPDAPPDDEEPDAIISSFQQAGSGTAGASRSTRTEQVTATTTTTAPPPEEVPSSGLCFGDPPRQTDSIYAPDCQPAFVGDNGGATYKNVTADEVRVGLWHPVGMPEPGPVPQQPQPGESSEMRTLRVLQAYFNQRYETYNRRIQLVVMDTPSGSDEDVRNAALKGATEDKVFVSTHTEPLFCDELTRHQLPCYLENPLPDSFFESRRPFLFGFQTSTNRNDRIVAEYVCKRLAGGNSDHAGAGRQGQPRKFGALYQEGNTYREVSTFLDAVERQCGLEVLGFDIRDPAYDQSGFQQISTAMSQFAAEGVTTIIANALLTPMLFAMQQAEGSLYFPEWVLTGTYGIDLNLVGLILPDSQMEHTFGLSPWEISRPFPESDCYRAYVSIDPNNSPNQATCGVVFFELQQVITGLQEAGPILTAESFQDGLLAYGGRYPPQKYAIQGGYAPGDWSYMDKFGEIWWNPNVQAPESGQPGAYVWTNDGAKYGIGEFPTGPNEQLFESGIARPG